jgi:hypothetical protein
MNPGDTLTIEDQEWTLTMVGKTYATLILNGREGCQRIIKISDYET